MLIKRRMYVMSNMDGKLFIVFIIFNILQNGMTEMTEGSNL